jgi:hypothetical protein
MYGHSGWIAIVIFGGAFAVRYLTSQRRRGRSQGYGNSFTRTDRPVPPVPPHAGPTGSTFPAPVATTSATPTSSGLAAGWFTDPFVRHEQRYWSGTGWTEHVTDHGVPAIDLPDTGPRPGHDAD